MVEIKLEYQAFPFLNYAKIIHGTYPSTFGELKPEQLIAIARLLNQTISDTEFLKFMTGFKKSTINKLDEYQRYQLMILFEPFTLVTPYNEFIIPRIATWTTEFFSPKPKLAQMTFAQFIFVESYFVSYQTDKKPLDLYKFVASLYLPQSRAFSEDDISASELYFAKVKQEILEAVVINYVLIKEWLANAYPMVFQKEDEEFDENYELEKKSLKKPNHNSGWLKIFESVVGDDLVNHDRYAILPLHNVLRWMSKKIIENIKRK
jgi:hypothetical protein